MDYIQLLILYRILIVLGGILSIYFGYRLFKIVQTKQGELRVKTGTNVEVHMSDVAPGVFFALFGASILVVSLVSGFKIEPVFPPSVANTEIKESGEQQPQASHGSLLDIPYPPVFRGGGRK